MENMTQSAKSYDVIGDIHGHADALKRLLEALGFRITDGTYQHADRRVIFLGDFIDRGPAQPEVLSLVRSMCDRGSARAILGNHEFNAVGWARGLKPFKESHRKQHTAFLTQFGEKSSAYWSAIEWFETLPVWLDLGSLRCIHACWHQRSFEILRPLMTPENVLTPAGWKEAHRKNSPGYEAAEILLKGPERELLHGAHFLDKDGNIRRHERVEWWMAELDKQSASTVSSTPVLFGHYWLRGEPYLLTDKATCLDFSVAADGYLTCYRWSGETSLDPKHLVYVKA